VSAAPPAAAAAAPQLLSPADAATLLSVTEADVIASLESGDLKGKRIGSQWRITRAAIDEFLK
jgi:excisionase family DNA binding protein